MTAQDVTRASSADLEQQVAQLTRELAELKEQLGRRADDRLARFHLRRLLNGATGTLIPLD